MADNNTNMLSYLEDRIIKLQIQINDYQRLINNYKAVVADLKKSVRVDMNENEILQDIPRDENVTL